MQMKQKVGTSKRKLLWGLVAYTQNVFQKLLLEVCLLAGPIPVYWNELPKSLFPQVQFSFARQKQQR